MREITFTVCFMSITGKICPEKILRKSDGHPRMVLNATMKVKSILLNNWKLKMSSNKKYDVQSQ